MFGLDLHDDAIPQDCEQRYIVDALTEKAVKSKFVQKFHLQCHCILFCKSYNSITVEMRKISSSIGAQNWERMV